MNIVLGLFDTEKYGPDLGNLLERRAAILGIRAKQYPFHGILTCFKDGADVLEVVADAAHRADAVVFLLDEVKPTMYRERHGYRGFQYTNEELELILSRPELLAKTRFFRDECELTHAQVIQEFHAQDAGVAVSDVQESGGAPGRHPEPGTRTHVPPRHGPVAHVRTHATRPVGR